MTEMDAVLSTEQVSAYLQIPVNTLYGWRYHGKGPRAIQVGRHLRYRRSEVDRWLDEQARSQGAA